MVFNLLQPVAFKIYQFLHYFTDLENNHPKTTSEHFLGRSTIPQGMCRFMKGHPISRTQEYISLGQSMFLWDFLCHPRYSKTFAASLHCKAGSKGLVKSMVSGAATQPRPDIAWTPCSLLRHVTSDTNDADVSREIKR